MEGRVGSTVPEDEGLAGSGVDFDLLLILHVELSLSAVEVTVEVDDEREETRLLVRAREASIVVGLEFSADLVCAFQRSKRVRNPARIRSEELKCSHPLPQEYLEMASPMTYTCRNEDVR